MQKGICPVVEGEAGIIIPHKQLSPEALSGLIEEFVTRDGTDSGYTRGSLAENVAMVRRQLDGGQAVIVYDNRTNTCNIIAVESKSGRDRQHFAGERDP
jgi:uncharacterized protein YheU (UPF0270 family)